MATYDCSWCGTTGKRYGDTCDVCDGTGQAPYRYSSEPTGRQKEAIEAKAARQAAAKNKKK